MLESELQSRARNDLNKIEGCRVLVTHGLESGCPDIIGSYWGRFFAIELKVDGKEPTPIQKHRLRLWAKTHAVCYVGREDFDAKLFLHMVWLTPKGPTEVQWNPAS